jgi:GT2 family glycosyltransferase
LQLSIVIVNYNVRHFLEQALGSVRRALEGLEGEVWVVDNNSVDDSVRMVREKFPEVRLIANADNPGFSKANNQAIRLCQGEYVLLLNPDTLVEEDTFRKCLDFMEAHPEAGALGCKLIDGSGNFLPESKRGFPSPWVAFCKTFGLSALFPRSPVFGRYYLGHLSPDEVQEVEVLAGCFMFMRRSALDKSGLLDEDFFMYGEDIDLSYRLVLAGYKNYYLPDTKIIHYKGESTKKGSLNYVKTFYQAMIIFARKHFQGRQAGLFIWMLQAAIWFRAGLTVGRNVLEKLWLPLADAALLYLGLVLLKDFWANYFYHDPTWFKPSVLWFNFPLYIFIWLGTAWLNGAYDHRYEVRALVRGLGFGTLILAAVYGFLDLNYRPSRALVLMGAVWAVLSTLAFRALLHFREYRDFRVGREHQKNLLLLGSLEESRRVQQFLQQLGGPKNIVGLIAPPGVDEPSTDFLGNTAQLEEIVRIYGINEIVFCSKDLAARDIMACMTRLGGRIAYKIVAEDGLSIVGSSSKDEPGELYTIDIRYNIARVGAARNKRVLDLGVCVILLAFLPVWAIFSKNRMPLLRSWAAVLLGKKTWVGYAESADNGTLPRLKPAVFPITLGVTHRMPLTPVMVARLNFLYAKDWDMWRDVQVLYEALR